MRFVFYDLGCIAGDLAKIAHGAFLISFYHIHWAHLGHISDLLFLEELSWNRRYLFKLFLII